MDVSIYIIKNRKFWRIFQRVVHLVKIHFNGVMHLIFEIADGILGKCLILGYAHLCIPVYVHTFITKKIIKIIKTLILLALTRALYKI